MGPHCPSAGLRPGRSARSTVFTVLICIPRLALRQAPAGALLALHDPGQPCPLWGCPIEGCGRWVWAPGLL